MNLKRIFLNKDLNWKITKTISVVLTLAFMVMNGVLGITKHSIWNGCVCIYYILLSIILIFLVINEDNLTNESEHVKHRSRKRLYYSSSILLFIMNISMFYPIIMMITNENNLNFGLIPAIAFAAYTTYKITLSIINYTKNRKNENLSMRQIRTIKLLDAILSILTLQNVLIAANEQTRSPDMILLSTITSFVGIIIIVAISIFSLIRFTKENSNQIQKTEN